MYSAIDNFLGVVFFLRGELGGLDTEKFVCVYFQDNQVISHLSSGQGTKGQITVVPESIVLHGQSIGADSLIVAHNHPTSTAGPSPNDLATNLSIARACQKHNLLFVDSVIVNSAGLYSCAAHGLLPALNGDGEEKRPDDPQFLELVKETRRWNYVRLSETICPPAGYRERLPGIRRRISPITREKAAALGYTCPRCGKIKLEGKLCDCLANITTDAMVCPSCRKTVPKIPIPTSWTSPTWLALAATHEPSCSLFSPTVSIFEKLKYQSMLESKIVKDKQETKSKS